MDSYGDGNVYRGQVCKDSEIKTIEINKYDADVERLVEALEGYISKFGNCGDVYDKAKAALEPFKE